MRPQTQTSQPHRRPRRLVVCCDGTWSRADQTHLTNVIKVAHAVKPVASDGTDQIVFYDPGVGTGNLIDRLFGGALGNGLEQNVRDAYLFLVHNYQVHDELFFFGFSRGAYTVRSLAGMIRNSGLLKKLHAGKFKDAYELYRRHDVHPNSDTAQRFRLDHSYQPFIKFIGVWDTVGALGVPLEIAWWVRRRYQLHDVELSKWVRNGYQALSIDDRRKVFEPAVWGPREKGQRIEQTWFAGCHADVGGGVPDSRLSDITLRWMADRAEKHGLELDHEYLDAVHRPDHRGPIHDSYSLVYRLWLPVAREIGLLKEKDKPPVFDESQAVHRSVIDRMEHKRHVYLPDNVREYLKKPGARVDQKSWG